MADPTHGPIQEEHRARMNAIAEVLDIAFNGPTLPGVPRTPKVAFVVLTANFGDYEGGRVNYISNGERADIVTMMKELIARFEGRVSQVAGHG